MKKATSKIRKPNGAKPIVSRRSDIPCKIAFEQYYHDNSGVMYAVRWDETKRNVELESFDKIDFPVEEIDWLILCLQKIKAVRNGG